MHLAQELLMNIQALVVWEVLQWRQELWRWGARWPAIRSWQWPTESIIKADPLITTGEVAEELNTSHSMVIWHLKQIGKVKKPDKGVPYKMTKNFLKIVFWSCLLLFYAKTMDHFSIRLWCVVKSGFYTTASSVVGPRRISKSLLKAKLGTKKGHGHYLVVCCWSDPLQLSESSETITSEKKYAQ